MSIFRRSRVEAEPFGVSRHIDEVQKEQFDKFFSSQVATRAIRTYWTNMLDAEREMAPDRFATYNSAYAGIQHPATSGRNVTLLYPSEVHSALVLPKEPDTPPQYSARQSRKLQRNLRKATRKSEPLTNITFPLTVQTVENSLGETLFVLPFTPLEIDMDGSHAHIAAALAEERRRCLEALDDAKISDAELVQAPESLRPAIVVGNLACHKFPILQQHIEPLREVIELALQPVTNLTYEEQLGSIQGIRPVVEFTLERPEIRA